MIDWKPIEEQYEDCSSRINSYRVIAKTTRTRLLTAKTQEDKIQANKDYKRAVSEFNKASSELLQLGHTIFRSFKIEISGGI